MTKLCSHCKLTLTLDCFYKNRSMKDGLSHWCKECIKEKDKNRYSNPEVKKRKHEAERRRLSDPSKKQRKLLKAKLWRHGLTEDQHILMYERQQGKCAWCGRTEMETGKTHCIDHCHNTGVVRRLLCDDCNVAEGRLKHFPAIIVAIEAVAWYQPKNDAGTDDILDTELGDPHEQPIQEVS